MSAIWCEPCATDGRGPVAALKEYDGQLMCSGCIRKHSANSGAIAVPVAVQQEERKTMDTTKVEKKLFCDCGTKLHARQVTLGVCKECRTGKKPAAEPAKPAKKRVIAPPAVRAARARKWAKKHPERFAPAPVATPGMVTMAVSEHFLESAWVRLTPELKAVAIAAALEA